MRPDSRHSSTTRAPIACTATPASTARYGIVASQCFVSPKIGTRPVKNGATGTSAPSATSTVVARASRSTSPRRAANASRPRSTAPAAASASSTTGAVVTSMPSGSCHGNGGRL